MKHYIENGLLKFEELRNDKLQIITTFDNSIWGNMNSYYANTEQEKTEIEKKDNKLCSYLNTNISFVLTTPPENSILYLNDNSFNYLTQLNKENESKNKFILIRSNAILSPRRDIRTSFIVAPADCPVIVITNKERDFVIVLHLGFPQILQNFHNDVIRIAKLYFNLEQKLDVFITPYICEDHYLLTKEKFDRSLKISNNIKKYAKKTYSEIFKENKISIDLKSLIYDDLKSNLKNINIIDTDICTYQESSKGNLFSHKYFTDNKDTKKNISEGDFNVIVNI